MNLLVIDSCNADMFNSDPVKIVWRSKWERCGIAERQSKTARSK